MKFITYNKFICMTSILVYRFRPDVDADSLKESLMELISRNLTRLMQLAPESYAQCDQDAKEKLTYQAPYDEDAW